jgi:hypothetical protein
MSLYNVETILPLSTPPGGNILVGDAYPAANYYGGRNNTQTVTYTVNNFSGNVRLEASLYSSKDDAHWFEVLESIYSPNPGNVTDVVSRTLVGNYVWVRVRITDFTSGTISTTLAY